MNYKLIHPLLNKPVLGHPFFQAFIRLDGLDNNDRTILEGRSINFRSLSSDYVSCPYKDGRLQHDNLMNLKAFQYYQSHEKDVYKRIGDICNYIKSIDIDTWFSLTPIKQLNIFASTCYRMTSYWAYLNYQNNKDYVSVPADISIISKMSHGLMTLTWHIVNDESYSHSDTEKLIDDLYSTANNENILVGQNEVCAAPPQTIKKIIRHIMENNSNRLSTNDIVFDQDIVHAIRYTNLVHYCEWVSVLYASLKLKTIRHEQKRELTMLPTYSYFPLASMMALSTQPLDIPDYRKIELNCWPKVYDEISKSIKEIKILYKYISIKFNANRNEDSDWNEFESVVIGCANKINMMIVNQDDIQPLSRADFSNFFIAT